jgi:hypothetical protein
MKFFKLSKSKILLLIIIFAIAEYLVYKSSFSQYVCLIMDPKICSPSGFRLLFFSIVTLINLIGSYLVSCILVWIVGLFRKK